MGGSPKPASNTTQTTVPWDKQQPYLLEGFKRAQDLFSQGGPQYYGGDTLAGIDPATTQALNMAQNRAMTGSPLDKAARDEFMKTAQGGYLNGSPYLDQMIGAANNDTVTAYNKAVPYISAGATQVGRYGSTAMGQEKGYADEALGKTLANNSATLRNENYQQERARMLGAAQMLPGLAANDYSDIQQLANVGGQRTQNRQDEINADIAKYNYNQNLPRNALADYLSMIQGQYGNAVTTSGGQRSNSGLNALGNVATGLGAMSSLGSLAGGLGLGVGAGTGFWGTLMGNTAVSGLPWLAAASSEDWKENKRPIDKAKIHDAMTKIRVEKWDYKQGIADGGTHIGPYAEEFNNAIGIEPGKEITLVDMFGAMVACIQHQAEEIRDLKARMPVCEGVK